MEGKDSDQRVMSIEELIGLGKDEYGRDGDKVYNERVESVEPEDVSAIIYTSGTTGAPKGVMFSNEGFIKHLNNHTKLFPVSKKSRGLSFLPMAHALELMDCHWRHVYFGFAQIYTSVQTLYDDVLAMKPTFLFQTPRFYEKIYNQIRADIDAMPGWKKRLIDLWLKVGARYQDMRYGANKGAVYGMVYLLNAFCHRLFFRKVHAPMGGKVEWATCGASPVPAKTLLSLKLAVSQFTRAMDSPNRRCGFAEYARCSKGWYYRQTDARIRS
jgi:long-chain acyl-CoA synthetase